MIATMQLSAAAFTELVNIVMICMQDNIMDCILNFIALGAIAQMDQIYFASLTKVPLKEAIEEPLTIS